MKQLYRRFVAMILVVAMGLTMLPMEAFAEAYSDATQINLPLADGSVPIKIQKLDENGEPDGEPTSGSVNAGDVSTTAPPVEGYDFLYAKVNNSEVSYLGSYNGQTYYSDSDNNAVLLIVPEGTTPVFYYEPHVEVYSVEYSLNDTAGAAYDGPKTVRADTPLNFQVSTPRGCETTVTYTMGSQSQTLTETSKSSTPDGDTLIYEIGPVTGNVQIDISVNEIKTFHYGMNYSEWDTYGHGATFNPDVGSFERGQSFTWTLTGGIKENVYWIMNGLEINGEDLSIPFSQGEMKTTTLSTGTVVKIAWTRTSSNNGVRYNTYTITVSNAYEDIYITGGNFRGSGHREVMPTLISPGVVAQWYSSSERQWKPVISSNPIGFVNRVVQIHYKLELGYENLRATVNSKAASSRGPDGEGWYNITIYDSQVDSSRGFADVQIICDLAEYTVNYSGGTQSAAGNLPVDSQRYDVVNNNTIYIPSNIPTANNVVFQGWDVNGDGKVDYRPAAQVSLTDVLESANDRNQITFTAIWESVEDSEYVTYTINLYLDGQTEPVGTYRGQGIDGTQLLVRSQDGSWIAEQLEKYPDYELPVNFTNTITLNKNVENTVEITLVRKTYTVTYNPNGGTGAMDPGTVKSGEDYTVEGNEFTKTGYKFTGWNTRQDGTGTGYSENATIAEVRENITLYAQWKQTTAEYTVKHWFEKVDSNEYEQNAAYGDRQFTGQIGQLTDAESYSVPGFTAKEIVQQTIAASGTVVDVYYDRNEHDVTYTYTDAKGDLQSFTQEDKTDVKFGATVTVATSTPEIPQGYEFSGWTSTDVSDQDTTFTMPDKDVAFMGSIIPKTDTKYTVAWFFEKVDGTYNQVPDKTAPRTGTTGQSVSVEEADKGPQEDYPNYVFDTENAGNVLSSSISGNGTTVLKLYFERTEFTVKYKYSNNVDGAPTLPEEKNYKWGTTGIQVKTAPILEGYVFSGWTTEDATVENNSFTMPSNDVTFTGSWTKLYTVTYDPNAPDAEGSMDPDVEKAGTPYTIRDCLFTRTEYNFIGWNTKSDGTGDYLTGDIVLNQDLTLYAQWEKKEVKYTIEYYLDDQLQTEVPYTGAPVGTIAKVGETVDISEQIQTEFMKDDNKYILDERADNELSITISLTESENVLKVYYAKDNKGGGNEGKDPDEIPDKYQVIFRYEPDSNGSITGITHETITKTDDVTTAKPTGTTFAADDGYKFLKWTRSTDDTEDNDKEMGTFKEPSYRWGSEVTFTVHFTKRTDLKYTVNYYWVGDKDNQSRIPIRDPETKSDGTLGDTVTLNSINIPSIDGYTLVPHTYQVTISANEAANVINVYYYKNVKLTANSDTNRVYTGEVQTVTGFAVTDKDGTVDNVTFNGVSASGSGTDANTGQNPFYPVTFTGVIVNQTLDTNEYYIVTETVPGKLIIKPVSSQITVYITGKTAVKPYSGEPQSVEGFNVTKIEGDTSNTFQGSMVILAEGKKAKAAGTNVDTYYMGLTEESFTWTDKDTYTNVRFVVEKDGYLQITPIDMPDDKVNAKGFTKLYTGKEHAIELTNELNAEVTYKVSGTNKETTGTATDVDDSVEWVDVIFTLPNYNPKTVTVQKVITPRNVTLTSGSGSKTYDGTALTNEGLPEEEQTVKVGGDDFVEGEGVLHYTFTGTQTYVGQSNNTFEYELQQGTKEKNYRITPTYGTLTVTAGDEEDPLDPTLVVTKSHDGTKPYNPDDTVTFTIEVTNIFDEPAKVTLAEQEGVTFNGGDTTYTIEALGPGLSQKVEATYTITEADVLRGSFTNEVKATLTVSGRESIEEKATDTVSLEATPALAVKKTVKGDPANGETYALGETITWEIKVTNSGNVTLEDIQVGDSLTYLDDKSGKTLSGTLTAPAGFDDTLGRGDSVTYTYSYKVTEADLGKFLVNAATATGKDSNGNDATPGSDEADPIPTDDLEPNLSVTKEAHLTSAAVGDTISYTITVTNTGNQTLNNIEVTDDLTQETWEIKTLAPGKTSKELTTTYTVKVSDLVKGNVVNTATAKADNGTTASGTAKVDVTGKLDISVNLASGKFTYNGMPHTVSGAATVKYGESSINVSDGKFTIGDTEFTLNFDKGKGTATETDVRRKIDGTVDSYPVMATPDDIKVTVDGSTTECLNITAVNYGTLTIEPATLKVTTKSAEREYLVGTALIAEGDYTGLQNGETLTFKVTGKQEFVGSSKNTYTITWDGTAKKGNYTIVENLGTLTVTAPANYDYVQKTHVSTGDDGNKLMFDVGDTITFQITVHNIYDKPATVTLTEKLENVTFEENVEGVTLTAGETKTFDATYTVTQADVIRGEINNTVEWKLTPGNDQQITGEDKDEVTDLVYEPSLSVTKTVTSSAGTNGKYALGDTIEYQIVVKNDGNVDLTDIKLEDVLKATSTDAEGQPVTIEKEPDGWADQTFDLKVGGEKSITASYKVTEADLGKTLQNFATATAENPKEGEEDVTGTGNTPGEKTDSPNPKLDVEKTVENADGTPFKLGEEIRYKIVVTNTGNVTLTGINVTDKMTHRNGDGTLLTGGVLLDENDEPSNGVIEKLVPKGQEGESSATFYYTYVVQESDLGKTIVNTATAAGNENKEDPGKGEVEVTPDARNPELKVVKTASTPKDGTDFALDETINYTITLTNTGNVTLYVSIRDLFGTRDAVSTMQEDITEKLICMDKDFDGTLKPEASVKYTYSYKVTEADLGKDIVNTVTYTAVDDTNVPAQQNEESVTEVTSQTDDPDPDLAVEKKVVKDAGYKPTGKDENGNDVYALDDTIHYRITVSNTGNVTLTGINVVDELKNSLDNAIETLNLPDGAKNFTLVPVGQPGGVSSKTFDVYYTVKEEDLGKTLVNTVTAASDQTKPDPEDPNNDDHDETDGEKTEKPSPNMSVTKEVVDKQISYRVGDVITYKITVNNTGNTTIHNIKLTDVMQASGDVKFTSLDGGKLENGVPVRDSLAPKTAWVVTCQYTVQLADADSDGNVISNKVVVTSDGGPSDDAETSGEKIDPIYTVVIKYQNGAGADLHDPAVVKVHDGQKYSVDSPNVPGYHLTNANQKTVSGTLDADSPYISEEGVLTLVVVYARNPVEDDDDDPVVNPDNDPDETTEETEDEVDPGVYIEDPDDYTLTPITEEEPPLADLDVGDHTCCIMHFLLMLAAMVVLGFYTDSKKKHQARIFELKRTLAMEKGKNPDGDNSQQS